MDGQQTIWSTTGRRRTRSRSPTTWTSQGENLTTYAAFMVKKNLRSWWSLTSSQQNHFLADTKPLSGSSWNFLRRLIAIRWPTLANTVASRFGSSVFPFLWFDSFCSCRTKSKGAFCFRSWWFSRGSSPIICSPSTSLLACSSLSHGWLIAKISKHQSFDISSVSHTYRNNNPPGLFLAGQSVCSG